MSNLVEDEKEKILKKNKLEENVDEAIESVCENLKKMNSVQENMLTQ